MADRKTAQVRLEDIAARVGVSPSEISRVLNGRVRSGKTVGPAMRERILATAREMNYSPNRAAQSLVRGRTDTAALMMVIDRQAPASPFLEDHDTPDELSPHYHEIIGGLTYTMSQFGIHLMLAQCGGPETDPLVKMEEMARSRTCDGMIITDMLVNDPRPEILAGTGLPDSRNGRGRHGQRRGRVSGCRVSLSAGASAHLVLQHPPRPDGGPATL